MQPQDQDTAFFRRSCGRKKRYRADDAYGLARYLRERDGEDMAAYHCLFANHYHIGHQSGRVLECEAERKRGYERVRRAVAGDEGYGATVPGGAAVAGSP